MTAAIAAKTSVEEIAKDLLSGDDEETQSSADDLTPSVTSHETSDFFPRPLRSNTTCDGDKESEVEDVETDSGNSPEDLRKEIMIGLQYQAEIPPYLGEYAGNEKVYENEDQLLWRPGVVLESKVKEYLVETSLRTGNEKIMDRISAGTHTRDNEQALYELLKCNHNIKEAIERYCCNGKASQDIPEIVQIQISYPPITSRTKQTPEMTVYPKRNDCMDRRRMPEL